MHLNKLIICPEKFPSTEHYPFNLEILRAAKSITFKTPVTFFIGENGTGKSTILYAIAKKCAIPIWQEMGFQSEKYSEELFRYIDVEWAKDPVPGSFFASERFQYFAHILDEWAATDPEMLKYYGGESLVTKSHGQCNMAYFKSRYRIKGLYFLDEPETALSPKKQLELLKILKEISDLGNTQFLIATHSPILLAFPGADIYSFDHMPVKQIKYEETDYYQIYKNFMNDRDTFLNEL
ncbi:MAG: AAA family ATPase [Eubacteriales bacterium]